MSQTTLFQETQLDKSIDYAEHIVKVLEDAVKARAKAVDSAEERLEEAREDARQASELLRMLRHEREARGYEPAQSSGNGHGDEPVADPLCIGIACGAFLGNEDGSDGVCNGAEDLSLAVPGQTPCPIIAKGGVRPDVIAEEGEVVDERSDFEVADAYGALLSAIAMGDLEPDGSDVARLNELSDALVARGIDPADWVSVVSAGPPAGEPEVVADDEPVEEGELIEEAASEEDPAGDDLGFEPPAEEENGEAA